MYAGISKYLVQFPFYLLTGNRIWRYKDKFEKTQWLPYETLKEIQWNRCKGMLRHAYNYIPYYREQLVKCSIHPEDIKTEEDYRKIPILGKDDIKNHFQNLRHPSQWKIGFPRQTSGSCGDPLMVNKDGENLTVMDAIMYRNYNWYRVDIGEKQAKFWGIPLDGFGRKKTNIKDALLNRIRFSPFDISEDTFIEFLNMMYVFKPRYVHGYAQTVFKVSQYVEDLGYDLSRLNLKAVIVTGEMIFEEQVRIIEKAFKCKVANEYGSTEVGTIAMSCPEGGMHLMVESLFIEFEHSGRHDSEEGEGEIIVTELYGKLMPLIRYRIGDYGIKKKEMCSCGRGLPLLEKFKGRTLDFIICQDGKYIDPYVFDYILKDIPKKYGYITQFRMIQEDLQNINIAMCYKGDKREIMLNTIESKMRMALGNNMNLHLWFTDNIPVEHTGKLRSFISHVKK